MEQTTLTNTTCPFCGIFCTDVTVRVNGDTIQADKNLPDACLERYAHANFDTVPEPRIAGEKATLQEAVQYAGDVLKSARHPLFSGAGCDVNTMRIFAQLARRHRGTIDHIHSAGSMASSNVMQNYGWVNGTMSEAGNRADLFVVLGSRTLSTNPRFAERVIQKRRQDCADTQVVVIGEKIPDEIRSLSPALIEIPETDIAHAIRYLNLLLRQPAPIPAHTEEHFSDTAQLKHLSNLLSRARYSCILWKSDILGEHHADIAATSLSRLIKTINKTTRCIGIALGNNAGEHTFNYVALWKCGGTMRSSFTCGQQAERAPLIYETSRLLEQQLADALIVVSPLTPTSVPTPAPGTQVKTIYIGHPATHPDNPPEVYIPTGIPGIDHAGHMLRIDSVVAIRLQRLRKTALPSAAEVLRQIENETTPPA